MYCDMKWINQITFVSNELREIIYIMKKLRKILTLKVIRIICLTLFKSIISFDTIDGLGLIIIFYHCCKNAKIQ